MAVINASYSEIENWIDNGTIQQHVALNDTINVSYGSYTMPFEVTGFEPTVCQIDGEEVTCPALNLFFQYTTSDKLSYGISGATKYSESYLRGYINDTLMGQLDQDFVAHLASTKVQTYNRDGSTDVVYDKLFAPSMAQLGVTDTAYNNANQAAVEGPAFTTYQGSDDAKRIKQPINATGTAQRYWTRSLYLGNSEYFGDIQTTGKASATYYNYIYRVVVACNFIGSGITPPTSAVDNVLVSYNGTDKTPSKILASYNNLAKSAIKCYASKDGIAKLVYPVEPEPALAYIDLEIVEVPKQAYYTRFVNKWNAPIDIINAESGSTITTLDEGKATLLNGAVPGKVYRIQEVDEGTFQSWRALTSGVIGFVTQDTRAEIYDGKIECTYMPKMNRFTTNNGTTLPDKAFYAFNRGGRIYKFPKGSFDFSKITSVAGEKHFNGFNETGALEIPPANSFNFPNVSSVGDGFMAYFNSTGSMYSIPDGSFDISHITSAGSNYLLQFNGAVTSGSTASFGALGQVPSGNPLFVNNVASTQVVYSNNHLSTTTIAKGSNMRFNNSMTQPQYIDLEVTSGSGTVHLYNRWSVPVEVDVKHIDGTISRAQLAGSPASSSTSSYANYIDRTVSTGDIIEVKELTPGDFRNWTPNGDALIYGQPVDTGIAVACTHMPTMDKFTEDEAGTMLSDYAFRHFNEAGLIESFPEGSFDTSKLTTVGSAVFQSFNYNGRLSTVPSGSFCFPLVTSVGANFMQNFNTQGDIYYLPDNAFDTRSIISAGDYYLQSFNGWIATGEKPPGESTTTYYHFCGALGKSKTSGTPLFVNNTSNSVSVAYKDYDREWQVISTGQSLNFNSDSTYHADYQQDSSTGSSDGEYTGPPL